MTAKPLSERFHDKVMFEPNSGCWLWMAGVNACGYGTFGAEAGRTSLAHRFAYRLHNGPIPDGMCVLHTCDMPSCVNPAHLRIGTHQDNMRDRDAKGRQNRPIGERNVSAKLTAGQVQDIRKREMTNLEYAAKYGVTHGTINKIWRGAIWPAK